MLYLLEDDLYKGDGVALDKEEAFKYFKMAADKGKKEAMFYCSNILNFADGIQANKEEALIYYKKAADKGHLHAMNEYVNMMLNGNGVAINKDEGIQYFNWIKIKLIFIGMFNIKWNIWFLIWFYFYISKIKL